MCVQREFKLLICEGGLKIILSLLSEKDIEIQRREIITDGATVFTPLSIIYH